MKKTAVANSNIALIKYWGKRDAELILPFNSSISMTLEGLNTVTTVEFDKKYSNYEVIINNKNAEGEELFRVTNHLNLIKGIAGSKLYAKVKSEGNFPKKAGLASSASGFAALTLATCSALDMKLDKKELSILSRRGSGSASRSIEGGFVKWNKGEKADGSDSYAETIADPSHWPELSMIVTIVSTQEKKMSSRAGMKQTVLTSPFYKAWIESIDSDLATAEKAIQNKNFTLLGETMENNALKMHATMHTTKPPIIYWEAGTLKLMKEVISMRNEGLECYFTMDAGPQVKILCLEENVPKILERLKSEDIAQDYFVCNIGKGAELISDHLF